MAGTMLIFDPVAPRDGESGQPSRKLDDLKGKVVGFIDNGKPNFNHLVDDLAELLVGKYRAAAVMKRAKRGPGIPAPDEVIKELCKRCDAVITGSGD